MGAAVVLMAAIALGGCGSDDMSVGNGTQDAAGNGIDRAFVEAMIPHHESAVKMARIAERRGQSTLVRELAGDIVRMQNLEIAKMTAIDLRLDSGGVRARSLGIARHELGMGAQGSQLETAEPFDRAFIDMMIPHHQGAIRMARVELARGSNAEARQLAAEVVDAQALEIDVLNKHRRARYGRPSPAGGVPAKDAPQDDPMDAGTHE